VQGLIQKPSADKTAGGF